MGERRHRDSRIPKAGGALREMVLEPGRDDQRQRPQRLERLVGRARQEIVAEGAVAPRAGHPDVAGAQPLAELREGAQLVGRAIDTPLADDERAPAPRHEPERWRGWQLALASGVGGVDELERGHEVLDRNRALERERLEEARSEHPDALVARDELGGGVEQIRSGERLGARHCGLEASPAHLGGDSAIETLAAPSRLDHRASREREHAKVALHLAHRSRRALVGLALCRASKRGHELLEHDECRVGQRRLKRDRGGREHGAAPERIEAGEVLHRDPCRLVRQPLEHRRWQGVRARAVDPEGAHVAQTLDELEHGLRRGRLRCGPEPSEPGELARRTLVQQRVEPPERRVVQAGGQHLVAQALRAPPRAADHRLEHERRRKSCTSSAKLLDENAGELARTDDRLGSRRQEGDGRVRGRAIERRMAARAHGLAEVRAASVAARCA